MTHTAIDIERKSISELEVKIAASNEPKFILAMTEVLNQFKQNLAAMIMRRSKL
jgi:hypothetical protein